MKKLVPTLLITLLLCLSSLWLYAQSFSGKVLDPTDNSPLPGVAVQIVETEQWAVTDSDGFFRFSRLGRGRYTLSFRALGYQSASFGIEVETEQTSNPQLFTLQPMSMELETVTITAREAPIGSVSQLDGYALKHTQPVSLADVLQLVPGQLAANPELGNVAQFTIRQAPAGGAAQRMNALGTALVMDGAPVSNNANLQANVNILNSTAGSLPPFTSVAGRGPDLRQIPADLIESVEVIRGVPSARHGDLTSGAVLVNTKVGAYRPRALLRVNPTVTQFSAGAGKTFGPRQTMNAELDITSALDDPRDDLNRYSRANLQMGWATRLNDRLSLSHRLTLFSTFDETRRGPADDMAQRSNFNRERGLRFNSQGKWKTERAWLSDVQYTFSLSWQHQQSYFQELVTRDIFPVTDATSDTTRAGEFGRSAYLNQTTVDGRPLNLYFRIEAGQPPLRLMGNHRAVWGMEWRHDSNAGNGRQFDPKTPPRQNYSMGDRPRSFSEIPALNQYAFYLTDRWSTLLGDKSLLIEWGFRLDLMNRPPQPELAAQQKAELFVVPAPRLNAALEIWRNWQIRAGYGVMAKMPTLSYLYPNPVFFDLINFNYFAPRPEERLVIMTTRRIVPDTSPLRPYRSQKAEVGIDHRGAPGGWEVSVSAFQERMTDAMQILRQITPLETQRFRAEEFPPGRPPVLHPEPVRTDTFMAPYDRPQNNLAIRNKGVDFNIQTPQIEAIRTAINLNGALLHTRSWQTTPFLDANRAIFSNQFAGRIPLFAEGQGQESVRLNTSLRLIHHIPALKFIVSGLVQTIWIEQNRLFGFEENPFAFIGRDGQIVQLPAEPLSPALFQELGRPINPLNFEWQERPPVWLFNIRLTKEWQPQRGFAFYVNNLVNSRPLFTNNLSGFQVRRAQPEFFFGAEVYYRL